ncbi:hypothetical protein C8035_v009406 [Colletotrichum spinosum]|uniref:Uncharacterized protein n=1 Tax=Colletotrichum spinosum TaxID=1347390 RepID=A0A4R8QED7_9PEZI|nr:hypothetical protein C8035_v009406 [Colletotrichum spinosum]
MSRGSLILGAASLPQDPYLPQADPKGPRFLDSAGVYTVTSGKWFNTLRGGNAVDGRIDDASNGPNTDKVLRWISGSLTEAANDDGLTPAWDQLSKDEQPVDAAPCWRPGAVPIQIQTVDDWESQGCSPGFLCQNNTVNSLPQYCPPVDQCQMARPASVTCKLDGRNFPMGPFEPVICQAGYYCPDTANGKETHICPSGTYCQPGAVTPTPCLTGSRCPQGSTYELFLIPLVLLVLVDVLMVVGIIMYGLQKRVKEHREDHQSTMEHHGMSGVKAQITGYEVLQDETDHEVLPMGATYTPNRVGSYGGFQAALEFDHGRLPCTWSTAEVEAHVTSVVDCLELSHVRDSLVGTAGRLVVSALAGFLLGLAEHPKKGVLSTGTFNGPYAVLSAAVDLKSAPELALLSEAAPPLAKLVSPFAYLFVVDAAAGRTGFHVRWLWRNMGTLAAIGTAYRMIAFLGLWTLGHRRRT